MRRAASSVALALAACGAPGSYMGLDLTAASPTPVQRLAAAARAGDKAAQLALGTRFEHGRGVPEDLDRACRLYESAAATTGGTIYVYSPPVGQSAGRVIPITTPVSPGLPVARERLTALAYRAGGQPGASACLARHR